MPKPFPKFLRHRRVNSCMPNRVQIHGYSKFLDICITFSSLMITEHLSSWCGSLPPSMCLDYAEARCKTAEKLLNPDALLGLTISCSWPCSETPQTTWHDRSVPGWRDWGKPDRKGGMWGKDIEEEGWRSWTESKCGRGEKGRGK